jgi:DNA-binding CsgD family transcriptional regulator
MLRPLRIRFEASGDAAAALREILREMPGITEVSGGEAADLIIAPGSYADLPDETEVSVRTIGSVGSIGADGSVGSAGSRLSDDSPYFTPRELEILDYLAEGWSNGEIAGVLRISERTVRFHVGGIYSKFGVSRRIDAVREALRFGLVSF